MKKIMEGSHAVAEAVKMCKPSVISAYPITPQTHIVEKLADMVANGELDSEYINVESEHSAMASCIGAQATGVRTFTATCSQGLALMWELLYVASGMRLPIVMAVANRALSSPLNIWNDWSDSFGARDAGWIQLYCETVQEAFDTILQAYRISENKKILLPTMVCIDGFWLSHVYEPVNIPESLEGFVKEYEPPEIDIHNGSESKKIKMVLDPSQPISQGEYATPEYYQEFKEAQEIAMASAMIEIKEINNEFSKVWGRNYGNGLVECYNMESAKHAIVTMGSISGTIKHYIETQKIKDIGLVRVKSFRPFPFEDLKVLENMESVGVLEKVVSPGLGGPLATEVKAEINAPVSSFIGGLGGRDITLENIKDVFDMIRKKDQKTNWIW